MKKNLILGFLVIGLFVTGFFLGVRYESVESVRKSHEKEVNALAYALIAHEDRETFEKEVIQMLLTSMDGYVLWHNLDDTSSSTMNRIMVRSRNMIMNSSFHELRPLDLASGYFREYPPKKSQDRELVERYGIIYASHKE